MLNRLAVYYPSTSYSPTNTTLEPNSHASALLTGGVLVAVIAVCTVLAAFMFVAGWKMFVKAGRPGWAALIPIYNTYVFAEIGGYPGWWGLYPLLGLIPFIGSVVALVVGIVIGIGVARNFGKSELFGVFGLAIFSFVGWLILGFGSAVYKGGNASNNVAVSEPPYPNAPVGYSPTVSPVVTPSDGSGAPKPPAPII